MGKWKELAQPDDIHTCHADCQNPACVAVRQAVAEEREACAKVCEEIKGVKLQGYEFAAAIRARGQS